MCKWLSCRLRLLFGPQEHRCPEYILLHVWWLLVYCGQDDYLHLLACIPCTTSENAVHKLCLTAAPHRQGGSDAFAAMCSEASCSKSIRVGNCCCPSRPIQHLLTLTEYVMHITVDTSEYSSHTASVIVFFNACYCTPILQAELSYLPLVLDCQQQLVAHLMLTQSPQDVAHRQLTMNVQLQVASTLRCKLSAKLRMAGNTRECICSNHCGGAAALLVLPVLGLAMKALAARAATTVAGAVLEVIQGVQPQ